MFSQRIKPPMPQFYGTAISTHRTYSWTPKIQAILWELLTSSLSVHVRFEGVFQAIQDQNTLRHQVSVIPGLVLMDYGPLPDNLLNDVEKEWTHIVDAG